MQHHFILFLLFFTFCCSTLAVSDAYKLLQDEDKVKKVHEILEEARAMVKATVSRVLIMMTKTDENLPRIDVESLSVKQQCKTQSSIIIRLYLKVCCREGPVIKQLMENLCKLMSFIFSVKGLMCLIRR